MKILAGRGFDRSDYSMDFNAIQSAVLNVSASKLLGFQIPQDAYQEKIRFGGKTGKLSEWSKTTINSRYTFL